MQAFNTKNNKSEKNIDFIDLLSHHCSEGDTGIIFVATNDNRSCKIFLSEGQIKAISMTRISVELVPSELKKSGVKACSFNDRFKLPYSSEDQVDSSDDIMIQLGSSVLRSEV